MTEQSLMLPTAASEPSRRHGHARIGIADRGRGGRCAAGTLDWTSQYAFLANRHRTRRQILGDAQIGQADDGQDLDAAGGYHELQIVTEALVEQHPTDEAD